MRSLARETVFKFIFSQLFNPCDGELFTLLKREAKLNANDCDFADNLLKAIDSNVDRYLSNISSLSNRFELNRIFNADKCALLIGMAELENFKDTPVAVIIDEAVTLSGKFSTEKSTDFVNGILSEYAKLVR